MTVRFEPHTKHHQDYIKSFQNKRLGKYPYVLALSIKYNKLKAIISIDSIKYLKIQEVVAKQIKRV